MAHAITITTSLGNELLFARMTANEHLGRLFSYQLQLLSMNGQVDLCALLGTSMTIKMEADSYTRYFNGIVCEAEQRGFETIADLRYASYNVTLVPKPWLLTRKVDCRIYTKLSVPDIIRSVLGDIGYADIKDDLNGNYPVRDYCVQYREDCFNFISRLMEQEGIYYYFTHTSSTHTMVLADALGAHAAVSSFETIPYCPPTHRDKRNDATITDWGAAQSVNSLKYQLTDYDPLKPKASLLATESVDHHDVTGLDVFDYPGFHVTTGDGQRYAQVRVDALNIQRSRYTGVTDACGMTTGALFTLKDFLRNEQNREYLVVGTQIHMEESDYASSGSSSEPFTCSFEAIESSQTYRSAPMAVKPMVVGLQTAVVTGSDTDEDIVVDQYGRVQVTFHWNKTDKPNAQSSCPVRVASPWAGKGWGAVSIPRVGQEVVVSFLEGDPDRPLIIGSVYNGDNAVPYTLPDNKTQSGIKSRSLQGAAADANELRFEDKQGSEDFFIHAQKDMHEEVENDHVVAIDHDETVTIKNDQTENINHDRSLTIGNNDTLSVGKNSASTIGEKFSLNAGTEIELIAGASSIVMKSSGDIEIKGVNITITGSMGVKMEGQVQVGIKAGATMDIGAGASLKVHSDAMLDVEGGAMATIKGPMLTLQGSGMAQLSGGIIMIG
jgi:type VI secretion system secreted protein VgrG